MNLFLKRPLRTMLSLSILFSILAPLSWADDPPTPEQQRRERERRERQEQVRRIDQNYDRARDETQQLVDTSGNELEVHRRRQQELQRIINDLQIESVALLGQHYDTLRTLLSSQILPQESESLSQSKQAIVSWMRQNHWLNAFEALRRQVPQQQSADGDQADPNDPFGNLPLDPLSEGNSAPQRPPLPERFSRDLNELFTLLESLDSLVADFKSKEQEELSSAGELSIRQRRSIDEKERHWVYLQRIQRRLSRRKSRIEQNQQRLASVNSLVHLEQMRRNGVASGRNQSADTPPSTRRDPRTLTAEQLQRLNHFRTRHTLDNVHPNSLSGETNHAPEVHRRERPQPGGSIGPFGR